MARRAPSSSVLASLTWRSRSFWYSRMPEAKMRSMGPANLAFCAAEANSSFRLVPDQNSRSKSSFSARMRRSAKYLRMIAAQLAIETITSSSTTSWTTKLAWRRRLMIERSWFMA